MENQNIKPFYMSYPELPFYRQHNSVIHDLEYLQQLYPTEIRKYQKIITNVINQIDYSGSMIYDQYPDRWTLYKTIDAIMEIVKRENNLTEEEKEKEEMIRYLISILLFEEIYKRRHL